MIRRLAAFFATLFLAGTGPALAEVRLEGTFVAKEACPAFQAFRKQTNPGNVQLEPGKSYPLVAGNKPEPTHYWVEVPGAQPQRRWVIATCGTVNVTNTTITPSTTSGGAKRGKTDFILALSWQPAFCEEHADKKECASQTAERFDGSHFTLHGLWPQPRGNEYCNVSAADKALDKSPTWGQLPEPQLQPTTRKALEEVMPGTQSFLERHEWIRHGTCFKGGDADAYFSREVALIGQVNTSPVQKLFADSIGKEITTVAIRAAFDEAFGAGAGERVRVACKADGGRRLITELTIGLVGEVGDKPSLGALMAASSPTSAGCNAGVVDPVGAQ